MTAGKKAARKRHPVNRARKTPPSAEAERWIDWTDMSIDPWGYGKGAPVRAFVRVEDLADMKREHGHSVAGPVYLRAVFAAIMLRHLRGGHQLMVSADAIYRQQLQGLIGSWLEPGRRVDDLRLAHRLDLIDSDPVDDPITRSDFPDLLARAWFGLRVTTCAEGGSMYTLRSWERLLNGRTWALIEPVEHMPPMGIALGGLGWVLLRGGDVPLQSRWARDIRDMCAEAGTPFYFDRWARDHEPASAVLDGVEHRAEPQE